MGFLNRLTGRHATIQSPKDPSPAILERCPYKVSAGVHDTTPFRRRLTHRFSTDGSVSFIYDDNGELVYDVGASTAHTSGTTTTVSQHAPPNAFMFRSRHETGAHQVHSEVSFFDDLDITEDSSIRGNGYDKTRNAVFKCHEKDAKVPLQLLFLNVHNNRHSSLLARRPDLWPTTLDIYLVTHHQDDDDCDGKGGKDSCPLLVGKFKRSRAKDDELPKFSGSPMKNEIEFSGDVSFALMTMFLIGHVQTFAAFIEKVGAQSAHNYAGSAFSNMSCMIGGSV